MMNYLKPLTGATLGTKLLFLHLLSIVISSSVTTPAHLIQFVLFASHA